MFMFILVMCPALISETNKNYIIRYYKKLYFA